MTRWVPFDQEKPPSGAAEYLVITAHGQETAMRWDGYCWLEKVTDERGDWYHRIYYPIAFWRWPDTWHAGQEVERPKESDHAT